MSRQKEQPPFEFLVSSLPGRPDAGPAIAASRCGATGILNLECGPDPAAARSAASKLFRFAAGSRGIKLDHSASAALESLLGKPSGKLDMVVLAAAAGEHLEDMLGQARSWARRVLVEATSLEAARQGVRLGADGLIAKGNEAGGRVGEETAFILLQRLLSELDVPVWASGGIGLHTVAACRAAGAAGVVLEGQIALARESVLPFDIRRAIERMEGDESVCLGGQIGEFYRVCQRPGSRAVADLEEIEVGLCGDGRDERASERWRQVVEGRMGWDAAAGDLWPLGQDAAFAASLGRRCRTVAGIVQAMRCSCSRHIEAAKRRLPFRQGSPLARSHGTKHPIVQGPMTRVCDTPDFALSVAEAGGLPFMALAMLRPSQVRRLLDDTSRRLGDLPWGVGILGFVPSGLRRRQVEVIREFRPRFALIAGGRPDQALELEGEGIATYLHVPSPALLHTFLKKGARRFVFEGRECGGHVGPRSSFVLWDTMIEILLQLPKADVKPEELHVLFAGGIHDELSAAMVAAMAAPLAERGARIGILMGTAYLFTREAVASQAIVKTFQDVAIGTGRTVLVESGPGHAIRCADTPFFRTFQHTRRKLLQEKRPGQEARKILDQLSLGRLRIASKGIARRDMKGEPRYVTASSGQQREDGLYMIGQLAALQADVCSVAQLHERISDGSSRFLEALQAPASRMEQARPSQPFQVAIIGMGCLLPKAPGVETFWANLLNKKDAVEEIPRERFDWRRYYDPDRSKKDKIYSKWGGFVEEVSFDPMRYGIPPAALASIDPLQLLTLEVMHQALRDADYLERDFPRDRTGVILGASGGLGDLGMHYGFRSTLPQYFQDVPDEVLQALPEWTEDSFAGILLNVTAGRVSNRFDLAGPNMTVDAACASSLAALYLGCRELVNRNCDMILVGGADTVQSPFGFLCFSKTQALSPRGRCKTFDESADGIAISEGLVALVLKRLEDAERDGDRIYAVIQSVAGASDGRGKSLTAPRLEGQLRTLQRAYAEAGVSPATVGLVEAHGTGTVAGDTAEVSALQQLLSAAGASPRSCALGSVKSMIGHTKSAAGVAGVMKAALALHRKILPPTLHVDRPNSLLQAPQSALFANTQPLPWVQSRQRAPRRAGVSSFGFGGTNFHAVLEEYRGDFRDACRNAAAAEWPAELLVWTAESPSRLRGQVEAVLDLLEKKPRFPLRDLAATVCGSAFPQRAPGHGAPLRLAVVASSPEDLHSKLSRALDWVQTGSVARKQDSKGVYLSAEEASEFKLAFLFPGQGSQHPFMLQDAALFFAEIREALEFADAVLAEQMPVPLSRFVFPPPPFGKVEKDRQQQALTDTRVAQPALAAVEIGLLRLLRRLGIEADMAAGHSFGEFAALHSAGVIDEEALLRISEARGRVIAQAGTEGGGSMAAAAASAEAVQEALKGKADVWAANFNAPKQTVIAGSAAALKEAVGELRSGGLKVTSVEVSCAFHTPLMEGARDRLARILAGHPFGPPRSMVFSNSLAQAYPKDPEEIRSILTDHLVKPVRFADEIEAMHGQGARLFVEVGPKSILTGLVRRILKGRPADAVPLEASGRHGLTQLLHALAQCVALGRPVRLEALFEGRAEREADLESLARRAAACEPHSLCWRVDGGRARPPASQSEPVPVVSKAQASEAPCVQQPARGGPLTAEQGPARPGPSADQGQPADKPSPPLRPAAPLPPDEGLERILMGYQDLMGQFLRTQREIMTAYLQGRDLPPGLEATLPEFACSAPQAIPETHPIAPPEHEQADVQEPTAPAAPAAADKARPDEPSAPAEQDEGRELLRLVSERTGYPPEMLDLDAHIEADLGIDSIKRVEILNAYESVRPAQEQSRIQERMDQLTAAGTLREIVEALRETRLAGGSDPLQGDGGKDAETAEEDGREGLPIEVPRFALSAVEAPMQAGEERSLQNGVYILTDDETGIARRLADELSAKGAHPVLLRHRSGADGRSHDSPEAEVDLVDIKLVQAAIQAARSRFGPICGIVHLLPLSQGPSFEEMRLQDWKERVQRDLKSLFNLVKGVEADLAQAGPQGSALVLVATGSGGAFSSEGQGSSFPTCGGLAAFLKTLAKEWPQVQCKAVDLDTAESASVLASRLREEVTAIDGSLQVGHCGQRRLTLLPRLAPLKESVLGIEPQPDWVILLTGGARGITAEIGLELARRYAPTLILAGRSRFPAQEEAAPTAGIEDAARLKAALIDSLSQKGEKVQVAQVEAAYGKLLREREMRRSLAAMRKAGATVEYHSVDVTDEQAFGSFLDGIYLKYGRLDAVVHGAGIIEDKLIRDKSPESFDRVLHTKADSAYLLATRLRPEGLKLLLFMSSVTAAFGNPGQADYGAANGMLNHLASCLDSKWPGRVVAINWGPWDRTGMVSPQVRRQFRQRGIQVIPPGMGVEAALSEIHANGEGEPVVVLGDGPWARQTPLSRPAQSSQQSRS